jgi:arylsulfatase A-like enzyme
VTALLSRRFWLGPWPWLVAAVALALFAAYRWSEEKKRLVDPRPIGTAEDVVALAQRKDTNVLFILIDTLRAQHLRTYGYARPTSPFVDFLASQGVRFSRQMSQSSWTKCSMASLWTGLHPQHSGVTRFDDVLPEEARVAAEVFRDAGFRTAGIWRNGWVEGYFGFGQGFDLYTRPTARGGGQELRRRNPTLLQSGTDMDAVAAGAEFLRINGRERWFLYLHLMDVHEYTYDETTARFGSAYVDVYDNAILHTNQVLDALMRILYDGGHLTNTLFIIASDHGEAFGERNSEGHARNVYPEVTEVPLVFGLPFRLANPAVVTQRTANVDIWPTVFDLLGLPALEGVDGKSRVPEILAAVRGEPGPPDDDTAIAHLDQTWGQRVKTRSPNVSMSHSGLHYVQFRNAKGAAVREELYDPKKDPGQLENQLDAQPEAAASFREKVDTYLAGGPPWKGDKRTLEMDEMQLNQLRALGYAVPGR